MKHIVFLFILFVSISCVAQEASPQLDIAMTFMRQGDYANAVLVLKNAHAENPSDLSIAKNLALCYYYQNDYKKGLQTINPFLESINSDDQCFQIAVNMHLALDQRNDAEKIIKSGLKKFPNSGGLYNDLGEMQWKMHDANAIKQWESGIQHDPSFPKNYFNAARYYYLTPNKVWCLLYGEIFVNMEPHSQQSAEIKELLAESYKKLFTDILPDDKTVNGFSKSFLQTMQSQSSIASAGITTESLIMIRTRFLLDWNNRFAITYPFHLFEYMTKMLQEGIFEAYNQWLFESSHNLPAYQNWINTHPSEFAAFDRIQKNNMFRMPVGEYYHITELKAK